MTKIEKWLQKMFTPITENGLYYKMRSQGSAKLPLSALVPRMHHKIPLLKSTDSVVVIGSGIASLSFCKRLKEMGHKNLTVVTKDDKFGGKCVNTGCMPYEFFFKYKHLPLSERRQKTRDFVVELRALAEQNFLSLDLKIHKGEVSRIEEKNIHFLHGTPMSFDRLVLATGNHVQPHKFLGEVLSPESLWELEKGNLLIISTGSPTSLSYASLAREQGLDVRVLFEREPFLKTQPSYQYFSSEVAKSGVDIQDGIKVLSRSGDTIRVSTRGTEQTFSFDHLMYDGLTSLNVPEIDGKKLTVFDLNFQTAATLFRSDISLVGDASGLLTASEGEFQGDRLARAWMDGSKIHASDFDALPLRLHGVTPLAMVGSPWALLKRKWKSVDFSQLGYTAITRENGKLWYLPSSDGNKIEAIHICHAQAGELIGIASMLIEKDIEDPRWFSCAVHPSAAEIFRAIADEERRGKRTVLNKTGSPQGMALPPRNLSMPEVSFRNASFLNQTFTAQEISAGLLSKKPERYFPFLLGLKSLFLSKTGAVATPLILSPDRIENSTPYRFEMDRELGLAVVGMDNTTVTVRIDP